MIVRNWLMLAGSNSIRILFHFLCTIKIARVLGAEDYGRFALVLTTLLIAQAVSSLALRNISIREISRDPESLPQVARAAFKAVTLATICVGILIAIIVSIQPDQKIFSLLGFILVLMIADSIWSVTETLAFSQNQMRVSAILFTASSAAWLAIVFCVPANMFSLQMVVASYATVQIVSSLGYLWWVRKSRYFAIKRSETLSSITSATLVRQSLPLLGSAVLALPLSQLPIVFLANHSGLQEVAFYGIATRFAQPLSVLAGTLLSVIYPNLSSYFLNQKAVFRSKTRFLFLTLGATGVGFAILVSLFSSEVIAILFGSEYQPAGLVVSLQVWVVLNWIMHNFVGILFIVSNREKTVMFLSLFNAILIGTFAFIGAHYGAKGLSLALWSGGLIGFSVHWVILKRTIPNVFSSGLEWLIFLPYIGFSVSSIYLQALSLSLRILLVAGASLLLIWYFRKHVATAILSVRDLLSWRANKVESVKQEEFLG